jgi:t-SNARE complex subunit (syntaxin)
MADVESNICDQKPEEVICQKSPCPENFDRPEWPKGYYDNVPKEQLEKIDGDKTKADTDADEILVEACGKAFDDFQSAKAEYAAAKRKKEHDRELVDLKSKNKKSAILQNYKNKLVDLLPAACTQGSKNSDNLEDRVPKDKMAICVAEFYKDIADESFNYQSKLKAIEDQWADAQSKWEKAQIDYRAAVCSARSAKKQATTTAEIERRKKISEKVQQLCK